MKFTVVWSPAAENELMELWLKSANRWAVSRAASRIDDLLKSDPQNQGESRLDPERILLVAPLGLIYEAFEDDRLVRVLTVWEYRTRGR